MGCWNSKEAGPAAPGHELAEVAVQDLVEKPKGSPEQSEEASTLEPSSVDVDVNEAEARDSVSQLPESDARPRGVQFGEAQVHTYEAPCSGEECHSHLLLQKSLPQIPIEKVDLETRAAGLKHIGFGPLKKENQDEFFVQVSGYGGEPDGHCYCIFDGHGTHGRDAAQFCRQELPVLFDQELKKYYAKAAAEGVKDPNSKERIEPILSDAFVETERRLHQAGVNVSSSGTTASVVYQHRTSLWVAAAGDSRVLVMSQVDGQWNCQPLTLDHRPSRRTEKSRVEAAGGRVEPKRLPSGKTVGEPRLWLANLPSPGLLLSRSIGDDMATSVGCTARPEVTFMALRPFLDQYLVIASDGVWDVLSNDTVAQLVGDAGDPESACQAVLETALLEWEERLAADNISICVVQYVWGDVHASTGSNAVFRGVAAASIMGGGNLGNSGGSGARRAAPVWAGGTLPYVRQPTPENLKTDGS